MLMIRLQRLGKKKQPSYRLIVSEKHKDPQAKSLEILGTYNPIVKPKVISFNADRVQHWLERGAQASDTVYNLLVSQGILSGAKRRVVHLSDRRREKEKQSKAAEAKAS